MNILKKRLNSFKKNYDLMEKSVKFYNNTKKRFFRKIGIVGTCIVCVFAPINNSYMQVKALTGVEEVAIGGILAILGLCGVGVAQDATDGLAEMADNFVKGYKEFGSTLADTVKDKWDALLATATSTGAVALDLFNSLTGELGNFMGDIWNSFSGGNIDNSHLSDIVAGTAVGAINLTPFVDGLSIINKYLADFPYWMQLGNVIMLCQYPDRFTFNIKEDGTFNVGYTTVGGASSMLVAYVKSWGDFSYSLGQVKFNSYSTGLSAKDITGVVFGSSLAKCSLTFLGESYTYINGLWHKGNGDGGLVLDPPQKEFPSLDLLDESYINYGDISDIALPRYVGPNATVVDGVVTSPGTWAIPNQYNPYHPQYKPVPLPFPLPNIGTVDGTYVGDITTDTPQIKDHDKVDNPDYKVPTIGDFLGDTDVPGKLNWKEYFPFCLPFDLIKFLGVLAAEPQTPKFSADYNVLGFKGTIDIDLKDFDGAAAVCRTLFNLLFITGLIFVTRKQIGA